MDDFIVTLPSNSSLDIFPDNTLSNFKVKLDRPIILNGQYYVGLTEIIYPYLNLTVEADEAYMEISAIENFEPTEPEEGIPTRTFRPGGFRKRVLRHNLPAGIYNSPEDIIHGLKIAYGVATFYNRDKERFVIELVDKKRVADKVTLSPKLAYIMGFGEDPCVVFDKKEASTLPDFTGGQHNMYIYSSIIEHQYVGHALSPLLRIVCPNKQHLGNPQVPQEYIKPYFKKVKLNFIDVIDIQIRTTSGNFYAFKSGTPVIIVLEFKKL